MTRDIVVGAPPPLPPALHQSTGNDLHIKQKLESSTGRGNLVLCWRDLTICIPLMTQDWDHPSARCGHSQTDCAWRARQLNANND